MQSSSRKKTFIRYIYRTQRSRQNERLSINQSTRHSKIVVIRITWSNIKQAYSTASSIKIFLLYLKISLSCSIVADGLPPPKKHVLLLLLLWHVFDCLHSVHILGLKGIHSMYTHNSHFLHWQTEAEVFLARDSDTKIFVTSEKTYI